MADPPIFVPPTLEGYLLFIRQIMGIPPEVLPDDAPIIEQSYYLALQVVNPALMGVDGMAIGSVQLIANFKAAIAIDARGPMTPPVAPPVPDPENG